MYYIHFNNNNRPAGFFRSKEQAIDYCKNMKVKAFVSKLVKGSFEPPIFANFPIFTLVWNTKNEALITVYTVQNIIDHFIGGNKFENFTFIYIPTQQKMKLEDILKMKNNS